MRSARQLILLVGSNPLPNYLVAQLLGPREIFLVHSDQTREPARRLGKVLEDRLADASTSLHAVDDAADAEAVARVLRKLPDDAHLDYTGGTKVMAAHARLCFASRGGPPARASYLFEAPGDRARLSFDDGYSLALVRRDLSLDLEVLASLHGLERQPQPAARPSAEEARESAARALEGPAGKQAAEPGPGHWLEVWTSELLRTHLPAADVADGVHFSRAGRTFELDVAAVHGHRLFVLSCTTINTARRPKLAEHKVKIFEAALRARQLGGDLSRTALICLLQGADGQGRFVDQLRRDVASVWDAPASIEIFGLDDLKEWHQAGADTPPASLLRWLDER